jgi:hypothetical protein
MKSAKTQVASMQLDATPMLGHTLQKAIVAARAFRKTLQGYPIPTIKKKRACVVTYRHSGARLLENSSPPHRIVNEL